MNDDPKYACPQCGHDEFVTSPNSYDRYQSIGDKVCWQATELGETELELFCRECGEQTPDSFVDAIQ